MAQFRFWVLCPRRFSKLARTPKPSGRKTGKSQSVKDLSRVRGYKTPKKVIVVVCEGEKTERLYFETMRQNLRIPSLSLKVIHDQNAPISVVNRAVREKTDLQTGDEVWCIIDVEQKGTNPTFSQAVNIARISKLNLAITNPAFEYWYLLHFECTDQPFMNADKVTAQLKKYLPNYEKVVDYNDIGDKTETAIENARKLRKNSENNWRNFPNSSTGADELVDAILKM